MEVPQKIKNGNIIWPSNSTSGYFSKENKNINSKIYMPSYVCCSISYNSQDIEATQVSINRWMDKGYVVYVYNGILLRHKKEWNDATCSNMDGPRDYHTEWSKSERETQISYDIAYMWNLKNDANELTYKTEIDSQT